MLHRSFGLLLLSFLLLKKIRSSEPIFTKQKIFLKKNRSIEPIFIKKEESPQDFCRSVRKPRKPYNADDGSIVVVF